MSRPPRTERGSVTAETAVVMPLLAGFVLCLCWLLSLGIAQVRVVDAARDGARAYARGEVAGRVADHVQSTAPGSRAEVSGSNGLVTVTVTREVAAPGWLLVPFPPVTLRAEASVLDEAADAGP